MIEPTPWFQRSFANDVEVGAFPSVVERLRGTPARVEEKLAAIPREVRIARAGEPWSIQENVGHLLDLEPLWLGRLEDVLSGKAELRPADLTNRATHEARHNERDIEEIVAAFRRARRELVARLDALEGADVVRSALHPRLRTPMRTIDLCRFVADHDDHHLALMTALAR